MSLLLVAQRALTVPAWAKDALWRRAQAVPSLDLRFADNKSLADAVTGASLVTFTRASSGTFVDSAGVLQTAATDVPRFDHNPTTGESLGLLVEEARTNLLLNSATLSTQSATVTAVAHTLHFTGTGTVTLTGVSTAGPLVGTGTGESNRVSLTFTPTAGSLTLTVSGTVTNAQLEVGAFRTSYIATTGATATRAADVASITGSAFSSFYNQAEGSFYAEVFPAPTYVAFQAVATLQGATSADEWRLWRSGATTQSSQTLLSNITEFTATVTYATASNGSYKFATAAAADNMAIASSGNLASDNAGAMVTFTSLRIGARTNNTFFYNGHVSRLVYWPQRLANSTLQSITQ